MDYLTQFQQALDQVQRSVLESLSGLIVPCRVLAAIGALFSIGHKVWKDIANNYPIDFYSLLRPIIILLCIGAFPYVMAILNGILDTIPKTTHTLWKEQRKELAYVKKIRQEQLNRKRLEQIRNNSSEPSLKKEEETKNQSWISQGIKDGFKMFMIETIRVILDILAQAALILIPLFRSVSLMILGTIGPLAFAFSCWPGFNYSLSIWLEKYVSISLWLPVLHIISFVITKTQAIVIENNMQVFSNIEHLRAVGSMQDVLAIIVNIICIVAYFCIPMVSGWVVQCGAPTGIEKGMSMATKMGNLGAKALMAAKTGGTSVAAKAGSKIIDIVKKNKE